MSLALKKALFNCSSEIKKRTKTGNTPKPQKILLNRDFFEYYLTPQKMCNPLPQKVT